MYSSEPGQGGAAQPHLPLACKIVDGTQRIRAGVLLRHVFPTPKMPDTFHLGVVTRRTREGEATNELPSRPNQGQLAQ